MSPTTIFPERELLLEVCQQIQQVNFQPDLILGISTGGLIPTRIIAHELDIKTVDVIAVKSYNADRTRGKTTIQLEKDWQHLQNKQILVVDDLVDHGGTMAFVVNLVRQFHPKTVKTAVIYKKSCSNFTPDFFARETPANEWINFSWD